MIRLGLRLTVAGGREALARLAVIAVAVAIGVTLLLVTIAGIHAVGAQNERYAWLETGFAPDSFGPSATGAGDSLWWSLQKDAYDGDDIGRIDVAATGPDAPVPPGLPDLPGPGELYASPAMAELLRATPADQLADRYPGELVGTIAEAGLPSPDILLVVVGRPVAELAADGRAAEVTRISSQSPSQCGTACGFGFGIDANGVIVVLGVVTAALLFPVLVFIGSGTRLAAARREQRFAAMRLVGATPRQVVILSTVEAAAAAVAGVAAGLALFQLLRPAVATIAFTGQRFFTSDLSLSLPDLVLVGLGVPIAAAVAAQVALRRTQRSPLGVGRRVTPEPPRAGRLVPLVIGLGVLAWFAVAGRPATTNGQLAAYLPAVLLTMTGLVASGPWFTMVGARLMAGRANRPAGLIAGRRLGDDPKAGFRAVSGVVLALFVGSGAVGIIDSVADAATPEGSRGGTVIHHILQTDPITALPPGLEPELLGTPGVTAVSLLRLTDASGPGLEFVASCTDLARDPDLGRCPAGAATVAIRPEFSGAVIEGAPSMADTAWPASPVTVAELPGLRIAIVVVANDGSVATTERVRTVLGRAIPQRFSPETVREVNGHATEGLVQLRQLANVVIAASLAIAGCSLAVGVAGGLTDRRRPFSLLRLTGVPLALLRRVVALETAVPLLSTAVVAGGLGFLTAQLFVAAQMERTIGMPGAAYWVVVAIGLGASLGVTASTLPLLRRITGPEAARND